MRFVELLRTFLSAESDLLSHVVNTRLTSPQFLDITGPGEDLVPVTAERVEFASND